MIDAAIVVWKFACYSNGIGESDRFDPR